MKLSEDDKQIIKLIKNLPNITDDRNKDDIFKAISTENANKKQQVNNSKRFIPLLGGISIITILFIGFFFIINNNSFHPDELSSESTEDNVVMYESSSDMEGSEEAIVVNEEEALFNDLKAMQIEGGSPHMPQAIPEDIQFSITINVDQLSFIFKDGTIIENNEQYVYMIESILMVAKSYGLQSVLFENSSLQKVGRYHLSDPIRVPETDHSIEFKKGG